MMHSFKGGLALATSLAVVSIAASAAAQTEPVPQPASQPVGGGGGGASDHDQMVGDFAVGYLGFRSVGVGDLSEQIQAPVIGVRYWLTDVIGIDGGVGLNITNNSVSTEAGGDASTSQTAFVLHGGVPLALLNVNHFSFQIVPELNFGIGSAGGDGQSDRSGIHFDVGARAGSEIHFGFMGVPQLSLQASVGLGLVFESGTTDPDGDNNNTDVSRFRLGTDTFDSPWAIFQGNVAAFYYFDM